MPPKLFLLAFVPSAVALAQAVPDASRARPERPTVATHAVAVAPGYFEIESGVAQLRRGSADDHAMIVTAKIGVARHAQLTIASSVTRASGGLVAADPVYAGVKWQIGELREGRALFALLPGLTFANGPRRDSDAALSLMGVVSRQVGPVAVDLNVGAMRLNGNGRRMPYMWAASAGGPVAGSVGWGLEMSGSATRDQTDQSRFLCFVGYSVSPQLALDLGGSATLSGAQGSQLFAGLTWNAGRVLPGRRGR